MDSMGQKFRAAREKKKINVSKAAALTRIKMQHIEMMENNDFSKMPAPAYAKGFIRIYASFLGLDPVPLVQEYVDLHLNPPPEGNRKPTPPAAPVRRETDLDLDSGTEHETAPPRERAPRKPISIGPHLRKAAEVILPMMPRLITAAVAVLLLVGIIRCSVNMTADTDGGKTTPSEMDRTAIMKEPPARYLELPAPEEPTP